MTTNNACDVSLSGQTGTGNFVGANTPTLITPILGTPTSGTLTNCTGLPVAGGGTGASSFTAYSVLCAGTSSTASFQNVSGLGTSGQVLTSNGAGALPTWQAVGGGSSTVVQRVSTITGTKATGTTGFTLNNSIPTNANGDQYMSLAITPLNSSHILVIQIFAILAQSSSSYLIGSLCQDSTSNVLAVSAAFNGANIPTCLTLNYVMTAGTTSSTTFKFRAGGQTSDGGTTTFNGAGGSALFGGTFSSGIIITEYTA